MMEKEKGLYEGEEGKAGLGEKGSSLTFSYDSRGRRWGRGEEEGKGSKRILRMADVVRERKGGEKPGWCGWKRRGSIHTHAHTRTKKRKEGRKEEVKGQ